LRSRKDAGRKTGCENRSTPRELILMQYCIGELLEVTREMDMKRGFDHGRQDECIKFLKELDDVISAVSGGSPE